MPYILLDAATMHESFSPKSQERVSSSIARFMSVGTPRPSWYMLPSSPHPSPLPPSHAFLKRSDAFWRFLAVPVAYWWNAPRLTQAVSSPASHALVDRATAPCASSATSVDGGYACPQPAQPTL